jgi:hypothetical protein
MMNWTCYQLTAHGEAILEILKRDSVRLALVVLAILCLALVADPVLASNVTMTGVPDPEKHCRYAAHPVTWSILTISLLGSLFIGFILKLDVENPLRTRLFYGLLVVSVVLAARMLIFCVFF